VLAARVFDRDDISGLAYYLALYHITEGSWRAFDEYPEHIRAVTKDQVLKFADALLIRSNKTTGLLLPKEEEK
jgi:predicted Zn-dependent peptidase